MKKVSIIIIISLILLMFSSCGQTDSVGDAMHRIKNRNVLDIGVVCLEGNEAHLNEIKLACKELKIKDKQVSVYKDIKSADFILSFQQAIENGHNLIFVIGEEVEDDVMYASSQNPDVNFCYANGSKSETFGKGNLHNYSIDEAQTRFIAGVAAGTKLSEMKEMGVLGSESAKVGFIAEYPDAESISAYTAFYLGIKSVYDNFEFHVQYTYHEKNADEEKAVCKALIADGCMLISQLSVLNGAATESVSNNVYFVGAGKSFDCSESDFYLMSVPEISSSVYMEIFETFINDDEKPTFWCGSYTGTSETDFIINKNAFADSNYYDKAIQNIKETEEALKMKKTHVFDTENWTVNSEKITTTANESLYGEYYGIEYINKRGYFSEYEFSASPKFAFKIDGIVHINAMQNEEELLNEWD